MSKKLTLFTGEHCHLCDQAQALIYSVLQELEIQQAGWQLETVSITSDECLQEKYGIRIPVVMTPDGEEKGWPFTQGQVKRMMLDSRK